MNSSELSNDDKIEEDQKQNNIIDNQQDIDYLQYDNDIYNFDKDSTYLAKNMSDNNLDIINENSDETEIEEYTINNYNNKKYNNIDDTSISDDEYSELSAPLNKYNNMGDEKTKHQSKYYKAKSFDNKDDDYDSISISDISSNDNEVTYKSFKNKKDSSNDLPKLYSSSSSISDNLIDINDI